MHYIDHNVILPPNIFNFIIRICSWKLHMLYYCSLYLPNNMNKKQNATISHLANFWKSAMQDQCSIDLKRII